MKRCIIMRGISGSGKSSYVKNNFPKAAVCSADNFFIGEDGVYRYVPQQQTLAHYDCWKRFLTEVALHNPLIVIDNTNVRLIHAAPYVLHAEAHQYQVEIITLVCTPSVAAVRNTHGVERGKLIGLANLLAMETQAIPPYWRHTQILTNSNREVGLGMFWFNFEYLYASLTTAETKPSTHYIASHIVALAIQTLDDPTNYSAITIGPGNNPERWLKWSEIGAIRLAGAMLKEWLPPDTDTALDDAYHCALDALEKRFMLGVHPLGEARYQSALASLDAIKSELTYIAMFPR